MDRDTTNSENDSELEVAPSKGRKPSRRPGHKRQSIIKIEVAPSTSRKRNVARTSRSLRNVKRARIVSSSDDDSFELNDSPESESSDSDEEYRPENKVHSSGESSSSEDVKMKASKEEEEMDEGDYCVTSEEEGEEESDSDAGEAQMPNRSKVLSKVQEQLIKQQKDKKTAANMEIIEGVRKMKDELLQKIEELGERLPKNTLDDLINKLGGSEKVAEMTGRKGRVAGQKDGTVHYESRKEEGISSDMLNLKEKERFMDGEKVQRKNKTIFTCNATNFFRNSL